MGKLELIPIKLSNLHYSPVLNALELKSHNNFALFLVSTLICGCTLFFYFSRIVLLAALISFLPSS